MTRLALAACVVLAGVQVLQAEQVFRAAVEGVSIDVLVTRDGKPVTGLTRDQFAIDDNGVPQQVDVLEVKDTPVSVLFALDTSASVAGYKLARLTAAASAAVAVLGPKDRTALLTFSQRPRLLLPFSPPMSAAAALLSMSGTGATALYDAMFSAISIRSTTPGRTLIIAFSDGYDSASWLDPRDVVAAAQRSELVLHAVTLQPEVRTASDLLRVKNDHLLFQEEPHLMSARFLTELTDAAGGSLVHADAGNMRETFVQLINEFRSRYVLTFVPTGVAATGWHTLNVKVKAGGVHVQSRKGYLR